MTKLLPASVLHPIWGATRPLRTGRSVLPRWSGTAGLPASHIRHRSHSLRIAGIRRIWGEQNIHLTESPSAHEKIAPVTQPPTTGIAVRRRTILQDLLRRHIVLIDGQRRGKLSALQTAIYPVEPGRHVARLATPEAVDWEPGRASSDNVEVDVVEGEVRELRTRGRGASGYSPNRKELAKLLTRLQLIPSAMYRRPWIVLELEPRPGTATT